MKLDPIHYTLILWFLGWVIHQKVNIAYRLKRLFKIKVTKSIKPLDCYTCFSFWLALALSLIFGLQPINVVGAYFLSVIVDKK